MNHYENYILGVKLDSQKLIFTSNTIWCLRTWTFVIKSASGLECCLHSSVAVWLWDLQQDYCFKVYFTDCANTVVPFSLYPPLPCVPSSLQHYPLLSSCPWIVHISSLASPFPILFYLPLSILCLTIMLLIPCTFSPPFSLFPLITLHVISISVILYLFYLFA